MRSLMKVITKPALVLSTFALAGTLLLAGIHAVTAEQIAANERQTLLDRIHMLVDPARYDNNPLQDSITLPAEALSSAEPVTVYRARLQGEPVAAIFVTTSPDGYSGNIRMVIGINTDQTISGIRVVAHKETPGLGDRIDVEKSDWIHSFQDTSLQDPPESAWAVKKDGGHFDQFTGATITPRAIVSAAKGILIWSRTHTDTLFEQPAEGHSEP